MSSHYEQLCHEAANEALARAIECESRNPRLSAHYLTCAADYEQRAINASQEDA